MNPTPVAKRSSTIVLQGLVVLLGIGALAFMIWEPQVEGRNAHATNFEIYFKDPFLAYAYLGSIAFFVGLFQVFKVLGSIGQNRAVSVDSVRSLRTIKYCALILVAMIGAAVAYLMIAVRGEDDIAGGVAMGVFLILASVLVAVAAGVFERRLRSALDTQRG